MLKKAFCNQKVVKAYHCPPATFLHFKFCCSSPIEMLLLVCEFEIQLRFVCFFLMNSHFPFSKRRSLPTFSWTLNYYLSLQSSFQHYIFFCVFFHYFYSRNAVFILWFSRLLHTAPIVSLLIMSDVLGLCTHVMFSGDFCVVLMLTQQS